MYLRELPPVPHPYHWFTQECEGTVIHCWYCTPSNSSPHKLTKMFLQNCIIHDVHNIENVRELGRTAGPHRTPHRAPHHKFKRLSGPSAGR